MDLVQDIHAGHFRYFGEGSLVQRTLVELLKDEWLCQDTDRAAFVQILTAFPSGCPDHIAHQVLGSEAEFAKIKTDLFGPLLVELSEGLALERLQQIRRPITDWEHILSRCWDTLPAQDSLLTHAPDMVWRVLAPRIFPEIPGSADSWERISDDSLNALTGWRLLCGTFDDEYPNRDIALWIGDQEPSTWPDDVDVVMAMICDADPNAEASATLQFDTGLPRMLLRLPLLKSLEEHIPLELARYHKYIQPEPLRGLTIIAALHELESLIERRAAKPRPASAMGADSDARSMHELQSFMKTAIAFLLRELLQGDVEVGLSRPIQQRGKELVRAFFSAACRHRFPQYKTLINNPKWSNLLNTYRSALRSENLSSLERQGQNEVKMPKANLMNTLFGQSSTASGDSLLRLLGPLVETGSSAESFYLKFTLHPAEYELLETMRRMNRNGKIPFDAVAESLRHSGYLFAETEAIAGILADRELVAIENGWVWLLKQGQAEREQILRAIDQQVQRLRKFQGEILSPQVLDTVSFRDLQAHLDRLRQDYDELLKEHYEQIEQQRAKLYDMLGLILATEIATEWTPSRLATHLRGIAKLLTRIREKLKQSLQREINRLDQEVARAQEALEAWALDWRKRSRSFGRDWQKLDQRLDQFREPTEALQSWLPLNDRLFSLEALCTKLAASDPALMRALEALTTEYRERFATDTWTPIFASQDFARQIEPLEAVAQQLLFSQVQIYLRELETLRGHYHILLNGIAPSFPGTETKSDGAQETSPFQVLYTWALQGFEATLTRLQERRRLGQIWRHPTKKQQSWGNIDAQARRSLVEVKSNGNFDTLMELGNLLLQMRQGFIMAAAAKGEVVYESPDSVADVRELEELLRQGKVRVRVEWLDEADKRE